MFEVLPLSKLDSPMGFCGEEKWDYGDGECINDDEDDICDVVVLNNLDSIFFSLTKIEPAWCAII